ncbi:cytochrome c-type biogenesis protein CcmH [bacterium]|nr:cytochrome c-type biogenesis protein CcmH [bacterium]|tara:strand:+ start:21101 stop:21481 length:381 start_codon:yes stop_codon:yes gene_type:complete
MKVVNIKLIFLLIILILPLYNSVAENKVYDISNELMCPVCQGQTVAESNSQLALSMKEVVRIKVSEGKSKEEILDYFILQYGDTILAKPPIRGFNLLLWILPPGILVLSILLWIIRVKRNNKNRNK